MLGFHDKLIATNLWLAQTRFPLEQLRQEFQRRGSRPVDVASILWTAAALIAAIVAAAVILKIVQIARTRKPYRSNGLLFLSLCRAHQLSWRESIRLWRLAKRNGLRPAALVFLSPEVFAQPETAGDWELSERLAERLFPRDHGEAGEDCGGKLAAETAPLPAKGNAHSPA
ncbi:MAG: hypothetical protein ACUVTW_06375 [Thermogutta sp.]